MQPELDALKRRSEIIRTNPTAAEAVREFLNERVANLARDDTRPDAELTAALTVSTFLGLTVARHFLHLDAFEHATKQDVERVASQWLNLPATPADTAETTAARDDHHPPAPRPARRRTRQDTKIAKDRKSSAG